MGRGKDTRGMRSTLKGFVVDFTRHNISGGRPRLKPCSSRDTRYVCITARILVDEAARPGSYN